MPLKKKSLVLISTAWCVGLISLALLWTSAANPSLICLVSLTLWTILCAAFWLSVKRFYQRLDQTKEAIAKLSVDTSSNTTKYPASDSIPAKPTDEFDQLLDEARSQLEILKETSRQHRQLVEHAVDVICLIDAEGYFRWLSPSVVSVWGYAPEHMVGKQVSDFIPQQAENLAPMKGILGADRSVDSVALECPFKKADGRIIHLAWSVHWSASDNGLFCVTRDITARVQAENRLRESEERTRLILESLPISVLFINSQGYIEMLNSTAETVLEYKHDDLAGRHISTILPGHLKEFDGRDLAVQLAECTSVAVTRQSGEKFPAELSFKQLIIDREKKQLIALQDVSERYAVEMLKRQFMVMVTHDIRAPLTSVRMLLEMFSQGKSTPKMLGLAGRAVAEIDRLSGLTNDLMDFETVEQGKFSVYLSTISIKSVLDAAYHAVSQLAEAQGITIEVLEFDASCDGDHRRLVQVLVNLLTNAVKYSPRGEKVIVSGSKENDAITISVKDMGRGVPAEKAKLIFDPYIQAEKKDVQIGTGLGLAICKGIVEQHGGQIGVESSPNTGSRFWFSIPDKTSSSLSDSPT